MSHKIICVLLVVFIGLSTSSCSAHINQTQIQAKKNLTASARIFASDITPKDFFKSAFEFLKIPAEQQKSKWIGGLAKSYGIPWLMTSDTNTNIDGTWQIYTQNSFNEFFAQLENSKAEVMLCFGHDCEKEYITDTSQNANECRFYVWHSPEAIWILLKIDMNVTQCMKAYKFVSDSDKSALSIRAKGSTLSVDGKPTPLYLVQPNASIVEISIGTVGRDKTSWLHAIN